MADLLFLSHDLYEFRVDLFRIAVQHPDPSKCIDPAQFPEEPMQALLPVQIFSVQSRLLGYEYQLPDSPPCQDPGFFRQAFHRKAPVVAPEPWNRAIRAVLVAAFGNLQEGVMPAGRHNPLSRIKQWIRADIGTRNGFLSRQRILHGLCDRSNPRSADKCIYFGNLFHQLIGISFRHAAGYDQDFEVRSFLQTNQVKYPVYAFFFGILDKAAGVDDGDLGFLLVVCQFIAPGREYAEHVFGIHQILVAAQRNHMQFYGSGTRNGTGFCKCPVFHYFAHSHPFSLSHRIP